MSSNRDMGMEMVQAMASVRQLRQELEAMNITDICIAIALMQEAAYVCKDAVPDPEARRLLMEETMNKAIKGALE